MTLEEGEYMATISLEEKNTTSVVAQRMQTVSVLEQTEEVFKQAFCRKCRDCYICVKDPGTLRICKKLVDTGVWDDHFCRRQES